MQDIEDLMMPESEGREERNKRLEAVRRHFLKKELENKSSEMIENQKIFLERKFNKKEKKNKSCGKDNCSNKGSDDESVPQNDFCGSEHDNWQPDILDSKMGSKSTFFCINILLLIYF